MSHVYPTHGSIVQETNKGMDSEPTKGVIDLGSVRRPKEVSASIDGDDDDVAVICTHRSKNSQHDLAAVNRFNSDKKTN